MHLPHFTYLVGVFSFVFISSISQSWANNTSTESLYGTGEYLKPELRNALSPGIADNLIKTGILKNLYQLIPSENEILDKDPVLQLIQILFYRVPEDPVNLLISKHSQSLSRLLSTQTIGKLLNAILIEKNHDQEHLVQLIKVAVINEATLATNQELKNILKDQPEFAEMPETDLQMANLAVFRKKLEKARSKSQRLQPQIERCEGVSGGKGLDEIKVKLGELFKLIQPPRTIADANLSRIEVLGKAITLLNRTLDPLSSQTFTISSSSFIDVLLKAIEKCSLKDSIYSEAFPFQVLMSFVLLKSENYKESLFEIWQEIPSALNKPFNEESKADFLQHKVSPEVFKKGIDRITTPFDVEKTLAYFDFDSTRKKHKDPGTFNQALSNTRFKLGRRQIELESSDCCEAAFRNFPSRFRKKGTEVIPMKHEFFNFLEKNQSQSPLNTKSLRQSSEWKELTSNLPGISYYQEDLSTEEALRYDMRPSVDNFINLMEQIYPMPTNLESSESSPALNRTDRLNRICDHVGCVAKISPPDEPASNQTWSNVQIDFLVKDPSGSLSEELSLQIMPRHCIASKPNYQTEGQKSFRNFFQKKLTTADRSNYFKTNPDGISHLLARSYLGAKVDSNLWTIPEAREHILPLLASQPVENSDQIWDFIQIILSHGFDHFFPMAFKYLNLLPLDGHRVDQIAKLIAPFFELESPFPKRFADELLLIRDKILKDSTLRAQALVLELSELKSSSAIPIAILLESQKINFVPTDPSATPRRQNYFQKHLDHLNQLVDLLNFHEDESIHEVKAHQTSHPDPGLGRNVRSEAASALGRIRPTDRSILKRIVSIWAEGNVTAGEALGMISPTNSETVDQILNLVKTPGKLTHREIVDFLGNQLLVPYSRTISRRFNKLSEQWMTALFHCFEYSNEETRELIMEYIAELSDNIQTASAENQKLWIRNFIDALRLPTLTMAMGGRAYAQLSTMIRSDEQWRQLIEIMKNPIYPLRGYAAIALRTQWNNPAVRKVFAEGLKSKDHEFRKALAQVIQGIGITDLVKAFPSGSYPEIWRSSLNISIQNDPEIVEALRNALKEAEPKDRLEFSKALHKIDPRDKTLIEELEIITKSSNIPYGEQLSALKSLCHLEPKNREPFKILIQLGALDDSTPKDLIDNESLDYLLHKISNHTKDIVAISKNPEKYHPLIKGRFGGDIRDLFHSLGYFQNNGNMMRLRIRDFLEPFLEEGYPFKVDTLAALNVAINLPLHLWTTRAKAQLKNQFLSGSIQGYTREKLDRLGINLDESPYFETILNGLQSKDLNSQRTAIAQLTDIQGLLPSKKMIHALSNILWLIQNSDSIYRLLLVIESSEFTDASLFPDLNKALQNKAFRADDRSKLIQIISKLSKN